jgi:hypothetical protein
MLKNWARISFLIFGGVLAAFSVVAMLGTAMAIFVVPQMMPREQAPPPGVLTGVLAIMIFFWLALAGLSAWWLYYFTRARVKEGFFTEAQLATPRRGPLSITIIAWLLAVGGCLGSLALAFMPSYPVFLFGFAFHGWMARLTLILLSLATLVAGVGMLRWHPRAHTLALAIYAFTLLSTLGSLILPGSTARMQAAMQEISYSQPAPFPVSSSLLCFSLLLALVAVGVPLWFLVTRRRAFLDACHAA